MSRTPFDETEALYLILAGDDEAAERTVRGMDAESRQSLHRAASRLVGTVWRVRQELDKAEAFVCAKHGAHPHDGLTCLDCSVCRPPAPAIDDPKLWTS